MGIPCLILGESGSGKSASLRNFNEKEVGVFNIANKPLPFRKKIPCVNTSSYQKIVDVMAKSKLKTFVIDDSQYLMCFEAFSKAKDVGYQKYTDMALNFYNLVQFIITSLPEDTIVYFLHHTEMDSNTGKVKAKTLGKMLDNQLTLEGLFSIVLVCETDGQTHQFITQSDGTTTAKSPMDLFPLVIDNDLKMVDDAIREYYEFNNKKKEVK